MRRSILPLATVLALVAFVPDASAQWFADGYVGAQLTSKDEITFKTSGVGTSFRGWPSRWQDVSYQSSAILDARVGKWLDGSHFRATADVLVFPITALVIARYGFFKDDEYKDGRLQPYAGVGGGLFVSSLDGSIGFVESSDTSLDLGFDGRLGVAYRVNRTGRRSSNTASPTCRRRYTIKPFGGETEADTTLNTNHS